MPTNFPSSLDALTNPSGTDPTTSPDHAAQHANANDAIEALEAKVGANSSGISTSLDNQMETHAHTASADDGGAVSHGNLTSVTADQHHTQLHASAHISGAGDALTGNLDAVARTDVRKNTAGSVFSRRRLNFIEGSNVTLTIADDAGSEEVDITIASTGGGGGAGASIVQEDDVTVDASVGTFDFTHGLDVTSSPAGEANIAVDETELDFSGSKMNVGQAFGTTGIITPTALSATTHDWNPTGLQTAAVIRVDPGASNRTLTGIIAPSSAPTGGRILVLFNIGSNNITLAHDDVGSTAANRFYGSNAASVVIQQLSTAILQYDSTVSRWIIISASRTPSAGPDADITVDTAGAAGTSGLYARSAHGHKITTYASAAATLGTAAAGTSGTAPSRGDHVHPKVTENEIVLSDITTLNASSTQHGFLPKWPNDASKFWRGDGVYASPVTDFQAAGEPLLTGIVTLDGGVGITLTQVGNTITIDSTGGAAAATEYADIWRYPGV